MSRRRAERKARLRFGTAQSQRCGPRKAEGWTAVWSSSDRAVNSKQQLTRDIMFAARDYLRISRAATDTTGASLTV